MNELNLAIAERCRRDPRFVPVVVGGVVHPIPGEALTEVALRSPMPLADFRMGLLALGWEVDLGDDGAVIVSEPVGRLVADEWRQQALRLLSAYENGDVTGLRVEYRTL